jgi:hypothetical protein
MRNGSTYTKVLFLLLFNKKNSKKVIRISTMQDSDRPNVNNHYRERSKYQSLLGISLVQLPENFDGKECNYEGKSCRVTSICQHFELKKTISLHFGS